jgi:molybdenum cofactor cytidylyltransferase
MNPDHVSAVVLAAGSSTRFGAQKLLAPLGGRPVLQHVLDTVAAIGFAERIVVLGDSAADVEKAIAWSGERRLRNRNPAAGLSSSLRIGVDSVSSGSNAVLLLLGDQPLVRADVIRALLDALTDDGRPVAVPKYAAGGGPNPVLVHRSGWHLANDATGDRGLGPVIAALPDLALEVPVEGVNPDVDTPADLAALAALATPGSDSARGG